MGYQNTAHVSECQIGQRRNAGSVALQEHMGRGAQDVQERGIPFFLFRTDTGLVGIDTRCYPIPTLRIL